MRRWLGGKPEGLAAFLIIASLVAGGLGWVTRAALRLEREQLEQDVSVENAERLRLALWRLDSRMTAILAREESRPFNHYSAVFAPPVAYDRQGRVLTPGAVLELSPLLGAELPPWMSLHFQTDKVSWQSPQVLSDKLQRHLAGSPIKLPMCNVTAERKKLLAALREELPAQKLLVHVEQQAAQTTIRDRIVLAQQVEVLPSTNNLKNTSNSAQLDAREFSSRAGTQTRLPRGYGLQECVQKDVALLNFGGNGEEWLGDRLEKSSATPSATNPLGLYTGGGSSSPVRAKPSTDVVVRMSPMVGQWLPIASGGSRLMVMRLVRIEEKVVCQGIVLDGGQLGSLLAEEVQDLVPGVCIRPAIDPAPEDLPQTMSSLPLYLDTGPAEAVEDPGWTTLRVGLSLAWAAALVALLAVGMGGWSLLELSQRRIRFVSAVTHELRTPLTTLQLYLDMLLGGFVRDEKQRTEYLQTLHAETDRLTLLVGNVLDFSRLENHTPQLSMGQILVTDVLTAMQSAWSARCCVAGKELCVENRCRPDDAVLTDAGLLQQVLSNLLDNACKYSRDAKDRRIWLRARRDAERVVFEVEDRGPGVAAGERRTIFRVFRRGRQADATTGGVGLGLALARRWTGMLGGRLSLTSPTEGGACFRVELPNNQPGMALGSSQA
jgi:signal transduction histidine kinase